MLLARIGALASVLFVAACSEYPSPIAIENQTAYTVRARVFMGCALNIAGAGSSGRYYDTLIIPGDTFHTDRATAKGESMGVAVKPGGSRPGQHGLAGMRERAELLGGSFEAGPCDDGGFAVHAVLPVGPPHDAPLPSDESSPTDDPAAAHDPAVGSST